MTGPIGKRTPYIDAVAKVTGKADYAADFFKNNLSYVAFVRSPHGHALIETIETTQARKMNGVLLVITGKNLPIPFGVLPISQDETALAVDKVRYRGELVAAVIAESQAIATEACTRISVTYKPLREFYQPTESLESCDADDQIHSHSKQSTNIHKSAQLSFNDPEKALAESPVVVSRSFRFAGLTHGFTEPMATLAYWDEEEALTVISATQVPHYLQRTLSRVLELPLHKIRVIKPALGGGFGGKSDPFPHEIITAYGALKLRRPVKCELDREGVFITNHGRHPTEMDLSVGADENGVLTGLKADILIDGGAYGSFGVVTTYYNGVLLQGPYRIDPFGFKTTRVYTNKPQCGAMRGHGAVNPRYAMEVTLDIVAEKLNLDPCDLREKNFLPADTLTVGQLRITSNGVADCLRAVRGKSDWDRRYGKLPYGRGLGVACGFFISGSALPIHWTEYPQTVVHVKLDFDGRIVLFSGASDIGQGSDTLLAQIGAQELGVSLDRIQVHTADTKLSPVDLGSYSSRVTFMVGNAARSALEKLRQEMSTAIRKRHPEVKEGLVFRGNRVFTEDRALDLTWDEAVTESMAGRGSIMTSGWYISPKMGGEFKGAGAGLSPAYSFGAFISEVAVNPQTGQVDVVKIWGAHDCGKALNPLAVEGQIEGSIHMGVGQALSEELIYHQGRIMNPSFLDYKIPTSLDTPEMDITIIESEDREGPYGAKEAGEGPIHPVIPAIGNAIYDAVGVRLYDLPMTPDKILTALQELESA